MLYKLKGYSEDWIEKRMRGIAIREELTDEWKKRGAAERRDYEILTAEISKATFGLTPSEYKKTKGLIETKAATYGGASGGVCFDKDLKFLNLYFLLVTGKSFALIFFQDHQYVFLQKL